MGRRLVVSDIHGEGHRLLQTLKDAEYEPGNDRLFLLGDYIDRGTDSKATVETVQRLVADGAIALRGNHDTMPGIVRNHPGELEWWYRNGGAATMHSYGGRSEPSSAPTSGAGGTNA